MADSLLLEEVTSPRKRELWSDHDIAGPHRIINKRKLDIKRITTDYWTIELKGIHFI